MTGVCWVEHTGLRFHFRPNRFRVPTRTSRARRRAQLAAVITVSFGAFFTLAPVVQAQADPDLVAEWGFDEGAGTVASDSSGNGNSGVLVGPTWLPNTPDGSASALSFDGTDDRVDLGGLDVDGGAITMAVWFNADGFPRPWRDERLISKAFNDGAQGHYWMLSTIGQGSATRLRFRLRTDGLTTTLIASSGDVLVGQWTHAAAVYDGSTMRLYQDGVEAGSSPKSGALDTNPAILAAIGNQPPGAGQIPFFGTIDDVRIYGRALTPAEIQVLATGVPPPLAILSPEHNEIFGPGDVTVQVETFNLPSTWGVEFVVDSDVQGAIQNYTPPFDQLLTDLTLGEHTVEAFVVDENGDMPGQPFAAAVPFGIGDSYVAFGDSITAGTGDSIASDNTSSDLRNTSPGFTPILNDLLTAAFGYPHTVEVDGVSGSKSIDGVARIPGVLAVHPTAQRILILFGTNDAWWTQTPSGLGLFPGDAGYAGSYKDNMSQIIDAVIADGKEPILSKPPVFVGTDGGTTPVETLNELVAGYGQVVDELVAERAIDVAPPDFYSHFQNFPGEFSDDVHPNGVGYQSMADLWLTVLTAAPSNLAPDGTIDAPVAGVTILINEAVTFAGTGTDPDGDFPLTYLWEFEEASSGVASTGAEDPGPVTFATAGTFTVNFTVTDGQGLADATPAAVVVTVLDPNVNQAPDGTIDVPADGVTIPAGEAATFAGTGSDPDGDLPLTYLWDFEETSSGVAPIAAEDPGPVTFATTGTFTVSFTVTDNQGLADATPATVVVTVQDPPDPDLVAKWSFDEGAGTVASDSSANGNSGILVGPTWALDTPDGSASALSFDGVNDRVDLGGLDVDGAALTIAVTFKADSFPRQWRDERLISKALNTATQGHYWMLSTIGQGSATRLRFRLRTDGLTTTLIASSGDVLVGQWTHAAAVYDGSTMRLYQDGVEVGSSPKSGALDTNPAILAAIGNQPPGAGQVPFHGTIDDVRIYRRAMALAEIQAMQAAQIVDNLDPGFAATGSWNSGTDPDAYLNAYQAASSSGTKTATWSFPIESTRQYAISAYWVAGSWAAEDAPYTIYNNGVDLGTVRVDQRTAGGRFNLLGTFALTPGTLDVVLSNDTGCCRVSADAVQVSKTTFAIVSPGYNELLASGDVTVEVETLGLPSTWGVEFVVDGNVGSAIQNYTPPFDQLLTGLSLGEHIVEAFPLDEHGDRASPLAAEVQFGIGDSYVAFGDSWVTGYGDNISSDNTSIDLRNTSRGFTPILNDLLTATLGYSHTVEMEGVNGSKSFDGVARIPGVLAAHPNAHILILFGANDALWAGTPSGLGLLPGDAGYAGSYKDNMGQIIEAVIADGREPVLAKTSLCLGDYSGPPFPDPPTAPVNILIKEYNQVIDALLGEYGITVPAPDLYTYFQAHPEEFFDDCHPNGVGYQSMANLWATALTAQPLNLAPDGTIDTPGAVTILIGEAVTFAGTGTDPDGDLPLTYLWDFEEASSGVVPVVAEDPGPVVFATAGTFMVSFTVTDNQGLADPTPPTVVVIVQDPAAPNDAPEGTIDLPVSSVIVSVGQAVTFTGTGSDPDGDLPLTYLWDFEEASSGVASMAAEEPGPVTFATAGTFTVSFTVTDSEGLADPTPATLTVVVQSAQIVDNLDPGFVATGSWNSGTDPDAYLNDYQATSSSGTKTATWSFTIGTAGPYAISAYWVAGSWAAPDTPYTIYNNAVELGTVRMDQRTAGGRFNLLGTFTLSPGTLDVVLSNDTGCCWVAADAVQVSNTTFAIVSPGYNELLRSGDVTVEMETLGLPSTWGVEFVVDGDAVGAIQNYTPPFEQLLTGLSVGEHIVAAFPLDEHGDRASLLAAEVQFGIGDYYVAFGDAWVGGYGDNIPSDNTSIDLRNTSRGFTPILNDLLTATLGHSQTVENEGDAGSSFDSLDGVAVISSVLAAHPNAETFLILFGANDALWAQTPSGIGLLPGDAGYGGSYKANMSQIIEAVLSDGREPVLAKASPCLGDYSGPPFPDPPTAPVNILIKEYNQVIDALLGEYGITVPAPDLYTYFETHPGEFYDDCYPNGIGYQSIANLWATVLGP